MISLGLESFEVQCFVLFRISRSEGLEGLEGLRILGFRV